MDQVGTERFLFDEGMSYFIEEELYNKHKKFFDEEIPFKFDFSLFEYSVALTGDEMSKIEKNYYVKLPVFFDRK